METVCPECLAERLIPMPKSAVAHLCARHDAAALRCDRCARLLPADAEPLLSPLTGDPTYLCGSCRPDPGAGTAWVEKRNGEEQGDSVAELLDASGTGSTNPEARLIKTGLRLTRQPLDKRDLDRITEAVQWALAAAAARTVGRAEVPE